MQKTTTKKKQESTEHIQTTLSHCLKNTSELYTIPLNKGCCVYSKWWVSLRATVGMLMKIKFILKSDALLKKKKRVQFRNLI